MARGRRRTFTRRPERPRFRINEAIRVPEIRLVGDNLEEVSEQIGQTIESGSVLPTRRVLEWTDKVNLDLVEISPKAKPPVCKLTDYKKFLYEKKKRDKEMKAKAVKTVIKEIRFGPNTDDHDFEFKSKHAKNFLEEGAKVKAYVHFYGRSIVFKDRGRDLLKRFIEEVSEFGVPENPLKMEGKRMIVIMVPHKNKKP